MKILPFQIVKEINRGVVYKKLSLIFILFLMTIASNGSLTNPSSDESLSLLKGIPDTFFYKYGVLVVTIIQVLISYYIFYRSNRSHFWESFIAIELSVRFTIFLPLMIISTGVFFSFYGLEGFVILHNVSFVAILISSLFSVYFINKVKIQEL
ncbi:MAG: hypothetical protein BM556_12240 [Bacteriovorax sp. MedPE-SWde]|nr:MAG: hypothetical protein BM556_12240 [Bacteriovorax sp. MedPE-SWde]